MGSFSKSRGLSFRSRGETWSENRTSAKHERKSATLGQSHIFFGAVFTGVIHVGSPYHLKIRNSINFVGHDPDMLPMIQVYSNQSGSPLPLQPAALPVARDPECPSKWRCQLLVLLSWHSNQQGKTPYETHMRWTKVPCPANSQRFHWLSNTSNQIIKQLNISD